MNTDLVLQAMDTVLPDAKIVADCRAILGQPECSGTATVCIEFDDGDVHIPLDVEIVVVSKAIFKKYHEFGFGTGYRALVALGGLARIEQGIPEAKYCFMTLYYTAQSELLTEDFHKEMR